ncbi:MAG: hypothetical protein ACKV19_08050 [Verrucomicrobiales bacterium]
MILVLAMGEGGLGADESLAPESPEDPPMVVTEHELEPAMDSNRQPLGPDPLVLPQWTEEEAQAMAAGRPTNLGGGLWTKDRYPLQPAPPWPEAMLWRDRAPTGALPSYWASRFASAGEWCVDPQAILDADQRDRTEHHLASHAGSPGHAVRVWVLGEGQSLGESLDDATWHRAAFGEGQRGVLVVAPASAPRASTIILPPLLAGRAADWFESVMNQIDPTASPRDQWDQLILWLTLEAARLPPLEALQAEATAASPPIVARPAQHATDRHYFWLAFGLLSLSTLVLLWVAGRQWLGGRPTAATVAADDPAVWLEVERPVRLGGAHSGGSGATMEW